MLRGDPSTKCPGQRITYWLDVVNNAAKAAEPKNLPTSRLFDNGQMKGNRPGTHLDGLETKTRVPVGSSAILL
jgi:hypothetical protein